MQSFGAIAQSNQLPAKFSTGELRYDCMWGCNFAFDYQRGTFDELYRNEDWIGLVKKVDEVGLKSRTSYFYLFRAAEKLKFYDAAQIYLNLAKSDLLVMGCFAINKLDVCKELTDINYAVVRNASSLENISKKEDTQVAASSTLLPTSNLPRCEGSVVASWNDCMGVIYEQGLSFSGQFRNGIRYGQFEKIANTEIQLANATTLTASSTLLATGNLPRCEGSVVANWDYCYGSTEPFRGSNNKYSGEFISGKYSGLGTFYFSNGNKYVGEFKDAYFNGQGTLYAANGSIINQGIWANDKFVRSSLVQQATIPNQEIERLRAEAAEAKRKQVAAKLPPCPSSGYRHNCIGTFTSADGEILISEYQNGVRFGHGIQYNKNGSILRSGTWLNDQLMSSHPVDKDSFPFNPLAITLATNNQSLPVQPNVALSNLPACPSPGYRDNCFGTFTSANGEIYVGEFKDDKRNGQGTQTYASGNGGYVGEWKDGKRNGQGTETYKGSKYIGEYKDNVKNGQLTYTDDKGNKYVGEYKNDMRNGQGTFTFADGSKYVGEYKDGTYNGQGTLNVANGNKYVGEFKDGKFNGLGTTYASNGTIIDQGIWADNRFVRSAPVQQATIPNQEIERLRAEAEGSNRKQAAAQEKMLENRQQIPQKNDIRSRNLAINWRVETIGGQSGNSYCQASNITYKGRNPNDGTAIFWINVDCRSYGRGGSGGGASGGHFRYCGITQQEIMRSTSLTSVCRAD